MGRLSVLILCVCFLLSGLSSLTLEVVWSKYMSYLLGGTLYGVATVVASFMGGLALGSAISARIGSRLSRPLRAYALIQFSVSIYAFVSLNLFGRTEPIFTLLYHWTNPGQPAFLFARFVVVFILVALPATLLGMTLPILVGAVARSKQLYQVEAGLLYGINTIGATLGTALAGFALLPHFGLQQSCIIAGTVDAFTGVIALSLDRRSRVEEIASKKVALDGIWTGKRIFIALLFGVSGMVAFWCEISWFRLIGFVVGPSVYAFSAMLAIYLLGIGVGSFSSPLLMRKTGLSGNESCSLFAAAIGISILVGLFFYNSLPKLYAFLFQQMMQATGQNSYVWALLALSALVVFIPCLFMGSLFPSVLQAFIQAGPATVPQKTVGILYLLNTFGAIIGSLTGGFFLIPMIGVWKTLISAGMLSAFISVCYFVIASTKKIRLIYSAVFIGIAFFLVLISPDQNVALLNRGFYRHIYHGGKEAQTDSSLQLLSYQEGINSPVAIFKTGPGATLHIYGKADASTLPDDLPTQAFLGHFPVMLASNPARVAVIGYGSGMTTGSVLAHPEVKQVDVIEIEQAVLNASPFFNCINGNPFADPRTRTILEDARVHFAYTDQIYDVISSEPSNPWMNGVSNLFTTDFYRMVRAHLSKEGVFGQWLQLYELTETSWKIALNSLRSVFPYVVILQGGAADAIVIASSRPIQISWKEFETRFNQERVKESFQRVGIKSAGELSFFFRSSDSQLTSYLHDFQQTNTDDNVLLESITPRELMNLATRDQKTQGSPRDVLMHLGSEERLATIQQMLPGIPIEDLIHNSLSFAFSSEPDLSKQQLTGPPFAMGRDVLIQGMLNELKNSGKKELERSFILRVQELQRNEENRYENAFRLAQDFRNKTITEFEARKIAQNAPDLTVAKVLLAKILFDRGSYEDSESFYRAVLDHPESASFYDALVGMGNLAFIKGEKEHKYDEALSFYYRAVRHNPYYPDAFLNIATIYWKEKNEVAAMQALKNGLQMNPEDPTLTKTIGSMIH